MVRQHQTPHLPASQHWIQDDQLQTVMKKLGATTQANLPEGLPDDPETPVTPIERDQMFKSGARLASSLAEAAKSIPQTLERVRLEKTDRAVFISTSHELRDQAQSLRKAAQQHNIERMQRELDAIRGTCISCHTRFKDIAGNLPPRA